jgi:predicted nucleic acid-binding protein
MLVMDASFAIPLFISDPRSPQAISMLQRLQEEGHSFLAPTLWLYEITSSLQKLRHFEVISTPEVKFAVDSISNFEIELIQPDLSLVERALAWSQRLQRASAYDSFYLALAEERGCELWTADGKLSNAVQEKWVRLLV